MKVLVIDDSELMRMCLFQCIEDAGCEIAGEASDGEEGFEKYKELKPDLVTLDITMPIMDGLECLKLIRQYDKDAKVVMCTAIGQKAITREALQMGALNYFLKPVNEEKFIQQLKDISEIINQET